MKSQIHSAGTEINTRSQSKGTTRTCCQTTTTIGFFRQRTMIDCSSDSTKHAHETGNGTILGAKTSGCACGRLGSIAAVRGRGRRRRGSNRVAHGWVLVISLLLRLEIRLLWLPHRDGLRRLILRLRGLLVDVGGDPEEESQEGRDRRRQEEPALEDAAAVHRLEAPPRGRPLPARVPPRAEQEQRRRRQRHRPAIDATKLDQDQNTVVSLDQQAMMPDAYAGVAAYK